MTHGGRATSSINRLTGVRRFSKTRWTGDFDGTYIRNAQGNTASRAQNGLADLFTASSSGSTWIVFVPQPVLVDHGGLLSDGGNGTVLVRRVPTCGILLPKR